MAGVPPEVLLMPTELLVKFATERKAQDYAERLSDLERRKRAQEVHKAPGR